jgi:Mg-chelatase subunit ChlD
MRRLVPYISIFLMVAVTAVSWLPYAYADDAEGSERPLTSGTNEDLDVVLLLDDSGSMRLSDPLRLRDQGAKLLVQFLKKGDRLAILAFSDDVRELRPLRPYDTENAQEVAEEIARINNDGQYTDMLSGLKAAKLVLENSPREDSDKAIILMTDGQLEPNPALASVDKQIVELNEIILPALKESGVRLHTISLSDLADRKLLGQMAQQVGGISLFAQSADSIHQAFAELFLAVKKPQVIAMTSRGFLIDQGIKEATFYINRAGGADVKLLSPTGQEYSQNTPIENVKWYRQEKFDVVTVYNPEVGDWQLDGLPSTESFATVLTNLRLITDFPAATINSGDDVVLQARFYEAKKPVSLPELTGVIEYIYEVIPTDKISEPIQRDTLRDDGKLGDRRAEDGIYSARIMIEDEGEYRLTVTAKAPTFVRQQQVPFRVKPRLVALSVETQEIEEAPSAQAVSAHGEEGNKEKSGPAEPATAEFFIVKLSEETGPIKNKFLRLLATDPNRKRYNLPLTQTLEDKLLYQVRVDLLPREGQYELKATLWGENKKREKVTAESNRVLYAYTKNKNAEEMDVVEEVVAKEVIKEEPSIVGWLVGMIVLITGFGMWNLMLIKRSVAGVSVQVTTFDSPEQAAGTLKKLQKKLELVNFDVNDAMYSAESILKVKELRVDLGGLDAGEIAAIATKLAAAEGELSAVAEAEEVQSDQVSEATAAEGAASTPTEEVAAEASPPKEEEK